MNNLHVQKLYELFEAALEKASRESIFEQVRAIQRDIDLHKLIKKCAEIAKGNQHGNR